MTDTEGSSNLFKSQTQSSLKNILKLSRMEESPGRGGSWEDVIFLGGEIYAKQIFSITPTMVVNYL
jgi:hypothetical protein